MNMKNMTDDELLFSIGEMQKEYISRVVPALGEGVTLVTDALPQATVFYDDMMTEAIIKGKIFWETGFEC